MTHTENRIAADDLRSHRELGKDLMKMESEKQKLALFDELVSKFDQAMEIFNCNVYDDLINRAKALQK